MIEQKDLAFEQAILIGIINKNQPEDRIHEYLDELAFLTHTAGGTVAKRFTQRMETPHPKTFIGSGKMEEVLAYVKTHDISTVVFDDELTPTQQSNIEQLLKCKILDRTGLIWTFLRSAPKRAMPAHKSSWRSTNISYQDSRGYGHTSNVNAEELECVGLEKPKSKPTVGLSETKFLF